MYKRFAHFKETRDIIEFGKKFDELCLLIAMSGTPFVEWTQQLIPITEGVCNEDELLNEFARQLGNWTGNALRMPARAAGWALDKANQGLQWGADQLDKVPMPQVQWKSNNDMRQNRQQSTSSQPVSTSSSGFGSVNLQDLAPEEFQQVKTAMEEVKKQFNQALQNLKNNYDKQNNQTASQVVKQFMDRVNKYADKVKFKSQGSPNQHTAMAQSNAGYSQHDTSQNYGDYDNSHDTGPPPASYGPMDLGWWNK